ncbi:LpxL/LpxP family acyltransferase [Yinghuangia aomiensis]
MPVDFFDEGPACPPGPPPLSLQTGAALIPVTLAYCRKSRHPTRRLHPVGGDARRPATARPRRSPR